MRGAFITFEGGEGSGKTTQIARAVAYLAEDKTRVVLQTRDPGGTPICDGIRAVLLDARHRAMDPMVELLLYLAARRQLTKELILPTLEAGGWVVCDRYSDSTWAYQVYPRIEEYSELIDQGVRFFDGLPTQHAFADLVKLIRPGLQPDLTIWLDVPVEIGLQRARLRASELPQHQREERFEQKDIAFHEKVRAGYKDAHDQDGPFVRRIWRVDASRTPDETWEQVKAILDRFIASGGNPLLGISSEEITAAIKGYHGKDQD